MYNYKEAIRADVKNWIDDNHEELKGMSQELVEDFLYDTLWVDDSVTGNASGSYTMSKYEARENFFGDCDSEEYLDQMTDEGFTSREAIGKAICESNWEWLDVSIRCWLLGEAIASVVDEMF